MCFHFICIKSNRRLWRLKLDKKATNSPQKFLWVEPIKVGYNAWRRKAAREQDIINRL